MIARDAIRFIRRGRMVELRDFSPAETLLDYLRLRERALGTKEACAEGDCGACTVALGRPDGRGGVAYQPVNACIHLLGMTDGAEIVTVEELDRGGRLHPVQQALVDLHGSQCGFCTPGFVMALFTLYHRPAREGAPDRRAVNGWIAGNLCRCTGYRPIVDAGLKACAEPVPDGFGDRDTADALGTIDSGDSIFIGGDNAFFAAPASINELAELYSAHPDAVLVAGATDVGLWITKQLRAIAKIIHLGRVAGFTEVEETRDAIVIGAGATYSEAAGALAALDPDIGEVLRRLGSVQIRAVGTVGGNIANGSPIGDMAPMLIALDAEITLRRGEASRTLPVEEFFIGYGKQDRQPGEFLASIRVARPADGASFRAYKIAKRFDQDISAVLGAFHVMTERRTVTAARLAFGGMAGTPKRAFQAEIALAGADLDSPQTWSRAIDALGADFSPLSDHRASAGYRLRVARGLLQKALLEIAGQPSRFTRVEGFREIVDAAPG